LRCYKHFKLIFILFVDIEDNNAKEEEDLEVEEEHIPVERLTKSFCHLSEEDKVGIFQAEATGLSYRKISQIFGRSERTIGRICNRYAETKCLHRKKGSGRKRKTSEREDRSIVIYVMRHRFSTAKDIQSELDLPPLSLTTIYARIKESVFVG
jgi:IS30 family transposase